VFTHKNRHFQEGATPLLVAFRHGNFDFGMDLVSMGADVSVRDAVRAYFTRARVANIYISAEPPPSMSRGRKVGSTYSPTLIDLR
jgi:hypothetical protein